MDVLTECYVDTNIIRTLLEAKHVNHKYGCACVHREIANRFNDNFAVGIVDDDKHKVYKENYKDIAQSKHLKLLKEEGKPHYLILVSKAAEDFILSCAKEMGVSMRDYGLPEDFKELKGVTKTRQSSKDPRITDLIKDLKGSTEMIRLKNVLTDLVDKKYKANEEDLKSYFVNI